MENPTAPLRNCDKLAMWGTQTISKLAQITPIVSKLTMHGVWYADKYSIHVVYETTNITGALHIVCI